jgi:hypothetical protein
MPERKPNGTIPSVFCTAPASDERKAEHSGVELFHGFEISDYESEVVDSEGRRLHRN